MDYIKKAVRFTCRHYVLALPLLVAAILSGYVLNSFTGETTGAILDIFKANTAKKLLPAAFGIVKALSVLGLRKGIIIFLFKLAVIPAIYVMIDKAIKTGSADLHDFMPSMQQYFVRYLIYMIVMLLAWFLFISAAVILMFFGFVFLLFIFQNNFVVFLIFAATAAIIALAWIYTAYLSMWFPAILVDGQDTEWGLRKSIKVVHANFSLVFIPFTFFTLFSFVLQFLIGLLPLNILKPVLGGIVSTFAQFTLIALLLMIYRDKTIRIQE